MTWLSFFLWLTSLYCLYYLLNILFDWSRQGPQNKGAEVQELSFIENQTAEKINLIVEKPKLDAVAQPVSKGLGGVSMKNLFELARTESINLTSSVSF